MMVSPSQALELTGTAKERNMDEPRSQVADDLTTETDMDTVPVGLCVLSEELRFLRINETMAEFHGYTAAQHLGRSVSDVVPDLEPVARRLMKQIIDTRMPLGPFEVAGETPADPGVQHFWMEYWSPVTDERGEIIGASVAAVEITERKRIEREREEALRLTERRLMQQTAIAELGQLALEDVSLQTILEKAVELAAEALHVPLTKVLAFEDAADKLKLVAGVGWSDGLVGIASVGTESDSQAGYTLMAKELVVVDDLRTEQRFSGPELLRLHGVISGMSVTIAGTDGRPFGVIGVHAVETCTFDKGDRDFLQSLAAIISNAVRQQAAKLHSSLLIREMSHRAGNMLQLVSSIAAQTFRHAVDPVAAKKAFDHRLSSLARANHAIAQQGWVNTRLQKLVEETLAPFTGKIRMGGRDVLLPPELCFDIGLVLNELCTNSIKYGSLSAADGVVDLSWRIDGPRDASHLTLVWHDPVTAHITSSTASSTGFGTKLMRQVVENKWHGTISVEQEAHYRMTLALPIPANTTPTPDP
jgi:PAS domain S-box-containing protein